MYTFGEKIPLESQAVFNGMKFLLLSRGDEFRISMKTKSIMVDSCNEYLWIGLRSIDQSTLIMDPFRSKLNDKIIFLGENGMELDFKTNSFIISLLENLAHLLIKCNKKVVINSIFA